MLEKIKQLDDASGGEILPDGYSWGSDSELVLEGESRRCHYTELAEAGCIWWVRSWLLEQGIILARDADEFQILTSAGILLGVSYD
ncbi:MAG: hypothetical protein COA69_09510 [Robiginitomaculum sp.]|nr:MAG: hypothetical protein COA69_09510 [Robiginitomaculum sp.]